MLERMRNTFKKLKRMMISPVEFFNDVQSEDWKPSFIFFLWVMLLISTITPILNYFGMESNDLSSSCQAQIVAYNYLKNQLIDTYGALSYIIEGVLILAFSVPILLSLTLILHIVYRLMGGEGSILNGWKSSCYGLGPCLLGGFLPYVSLFAAFYSFSMQFYIGPMTLYRVKQSKAIIIFSSFIALAFIEMFVFGTTVGW
jgi:hypothetical protein